jgi:hypothetical protein
LIQRKAPNPEPGHRWRPGAGSHATAPRSEDVPVTQVLQIEAGRSYALVEDGLWWPGLYDSLQTARRAADFPQTILAGLQTRKNAEADRSRRIITLADLDAVA